jgi:hypothetical protein
MFNKFYALTVHTYLLLQEMKDCVHRLERADADSSGSTLRTAGVVILVVAVLITIGKAILTLSGEVANRITSVDKPW